VTDGSSGYVRLTGNRCRCRACDQLFNSVRAFDAHRTGTFRPLSRRCRSADEMRARGMSVNAHGFWITETRKERATRRGQTRRRRDPAHLPTLVAAPTPMVP
jgi:hypothetical protein